VIGSVVAWHKSRGNPDAQKFFAAGRADKAGLISVRTTGHPKKKQAIWLAFFHTKSLWPDKELFLTNGASAIYNESGANLQ
jgi:hypothetical protein